MLNKYTVDVVFNNADITRHVLIDLYELSRIQISYDQHSVLRNLDT